MYPRISRLRRASLAALAAAAAAFAVPGPAHAQYCTEEPCGPLDPNGPAVTISPGSSVRSAGPVTITIQWSDNTQLSHGSHEVMLDGVNVTSSFTYNYSNNWTATSTGTLTLSGVGEHALVASIIDGAGNDGFATATYTIPSPAVRVTPEPGAATVAGGGPGAARFRVVNTGSAATVYTMITPCPAGFTGCAASTPTLTLAGGDSAFVDVGFTAPATGSGWIQLSAASGSVSHFGGVTITAQAAPAPGFPGDAKSMERIQRSGCVAVGFGSAAASECGDLVVAHALPPVRLLNAASAPSLVYNSSHARPMPIVAEQLAGPAGAVPDSIRAVLLVNGVQVSAGRWKGWGADQTRRIALSFEASSPTTYPTGVYTYTLQVTAEWLSGTQQSLTVRTGRMVIVNRSASPFGAGWWLSGVEQLVSVPGDTVKLWVGGDGSARLYRGNPGGPWRAEGYDRPDSLYNGVAGALGTVTVRTLPGRAAEAWFDPVSGKHLRTINFMQQYTGYTWSGNYLTRISLPHVAARGDTARYLFEYNNNPTASQRNLSRVAAPGLSGTRDTWFTTDATGRITRITDLDSSYVGFAYSGGTKWMTQRTDRRLATHAFGYLRARLHSSVRTVSPGVTSTVRVQAVHTLGMNGTSVRSDSVYAIYDGARTEFCDCIWWKVDRWGAPLERRDPYGSVTRVARGDPRWPGLVTQVTAPNGFITTATYDGRGNLGTSTEWNPYGDGRNATTTYQWDPLWDAPTRIVSPDGEVTTLGYDAYRRRMWEQPGPDASRRVSYDYVPLTDPRAPGLVQSVSLPRGTFRYEYDTSGNLEASITPQFNTRTEYLNDALGQPIRTRIPADSAAGMFVGWRSDSTVYDRAGRVVYTVSSGPAMNGAPQQQQHVVHEYDLEGNLTAVERWGTPELASNPLGHARTVWRYDLGGRRVAEVAPDGAVDSVYYDLAGNAKEVHTRRTDPVTGGRLVLRMVYDAANRLVERQLPQVSYGARDAGIPLGYRTTAPHCTGTMMDRTYPGRPNDGGCGYRIDAQTETFAYDGMGNLRLADNADAQVHRGYYPGGALASDTTRIRVTTGTDFAAHTYVTNHRYDRSGRRAELDHPAQLAPSAGQRTARYGYDPATGALAWVTDPMGNRYRYEYSTSGDLTRRIFEGGMTDQFEYWADGTLSMFSTTAFNPAETLHYTSFRRDAAGRVLSATSWLGRRDSLVVRYSGLGHAAYTVSRSYGDATSTPTWTGTERFTYDALGNMATRYDNDSTRLYDGTIREDYTRHSTVFAAGTGRLVTSTAYDFTGTTTREGMPISIGTTNQPVYDGAGNVIFSSQVYTSTGSCSSKVKEEADCSDRAVFYAADGRVRAAEQRVRLGSDNAGYFRATFEEYRYDALGRRVWVRNRQECFNGLAPATQGWPLSPCYSTLRRTVWDGAHELWEIQMPGSDSSAYLENDVNPVAIQPYIKWYPAPGSELPPGTFYEYKKYSWYDPNPMHGRVGYTHGVSVDQPLSLMRVGLNRYYAAEYPGTVGQGASFAPFAAVPLWDWRGRAAGAVYAGGAKQHCQTLSGTARCVSVAGGGQWSTYGSGPTPLQWHGTVLGGKADGVGTLYRRARQYDPATGRFTQEDPIGLAGGLNLYGYAGGDPVNFIDPMGENPWAIGLGLVGAGVGGYYGYRHGGWKGAVVGGLAGGALGVAAGFGIAAGIQALSAPGVSVQLGQLQVVNAAGKAATVSQSAASAGAATATGAAQLAIQFGKDPNQVYHAFRHVVQMGLDPNVVRAAVEQHLPTVISQLQPGRPLNQIITVAGQRIQYTAFQLANGVINIGRIHGVP